MSPRLKFIAGFVLIVLFARASVVAAQFAVTSNSVLVLSTREAAGRALATEDDFIRALSEFDRASRTKSEEISRAEFLKFVAGEVLAWTESDTTRLERAAAGAKEKLTPFTLPLPHEILLVKTTGREEANTAYCRGTNVIVLSPRFLSASAEELESTLIHELFHIFSRNNPGLREKIYALIGFKPCGEIKLPAELEARHITNPDAPRLDFCIDVKRRGQIVSVVPVLFATPAHWTKAKGGEFFAYFTYKLMALEHTEAGWRTAENDGRPVLLGLQEVTGLREQVGVQPGPVLQAEEISAEYFERMVEGHGTVPPPVRDGMRRLLSRSKP